MRRAALTDETLGAVPQFVYLVAFSTKWKIAKRVSFDAFGVVAGRRACVAGGTDAAPVDTDGSALAVVELGTPSLIQLPRGAGDASLSLAAALTSSTRRTTLHLRRRIAVHGTLVACVHVRRTTAADELLMIAQTEESIGRHPTDAALAQTGARRAEHAFRTRLRLGRVARVSSVPRWNALSSAWMFLLAQRIAHADSDRAAFVQPVACLAALEGIVRLSTVIALLAVD